MADGSAKLSGRDYEFQQSTPRRQSSVRKESLSGESHGVREEFQTEETQEFTRTSGPFKVISFIVIMLNRSSVVCAERRIIPNCTEANSYSFGRCKRKIDLTIIGVSKIEACQMCGEV